MRSAHSFDGLTALDANEVRALFAALRSHPGNLATLEHTFERLKDRLTPSGQAAYHRELSKLLQRTQALPQSVPELLDGEYGLVLRGDLEALGTLSCQDGEYTLVVPFDPALTMAVDVDGTIDHAGPPPARGELRVQEGYLSLGLEITVESAGVLARKCLTGMGDVRSGRA